MSDESINAPTTSNKILNPSLDYIGSKIRVKFRGDYLKQENVTFNHGKIVNIYTYDFSADYDAIEVDKLLLINYALTSIG